MRLDTLSQFQDNSHPSENHIFHGFLVCIPTIQLRMQRVVPGSVARNKKVWIYHAPVAQLRMQRVVPGSVARNKKVWIYHAPVAQLDRVPGYELGGRTFESCRVRHLNRKTIKQLLHYVECCFFCAFLWCSKKCTTHIFSTNIVGKTRLTSAFGH